MIKVKEFYENGVLDKQINEFVKENDIEIIDIKYSAFIENFDMLYVGSRALLIYKDKE